MVSRLWQYVYASIGHGLLLAVLLLLLLIRWNR